MCLSWQIYSGRARYNSSLNHPKQHKAKDVLRWKKKKHYMAVSTLQVQKVLFQKCLVLRKSKIQNRNVPLNAWIQAAFHRKVQINSSTIPLSDTGSVLMPKQRKITQNSHKESQCGPEEMLWSPTWSLQPLQSWHNSNNNNDIGTVLTHQWLCEWDIMDVEKLINYKINCNSV